MNKRGFTLLELLIIIVVLCVIFLFSIPIIRIIIKNSRFGVFENSVYSAIDSVDIYIVNHDWAQIPPEGLEISALDESILKNNNFDEGIFVREDSHVRIIYIKQGNFCAKGTKENLITTDKGCGALDESAPTKANLFLKNTDVDNMYIVAAGYDPDSRIIKYELSVDNGNYYSNSDKSYNVFAIPINDNLEHSFKVRVTNEAGLTKESEIKKFKYKNSSNILLFETNNLKDVQPLKKFNFNQNENISYEYSEDLKNWQKLTNDIVVNTNKVIYIKTTANNVVSYNTLNISNIDSTLNGAYPVLNDNMIPVIYDGSNWIVANKNQIYWDYDNGIFANMVLVKKNKTLNDDNSKPRSYYLSDEAIGDIVYQNDILAYFVWIPRYKYKIWNVFGDKELIETEIYFENKNSEISSGTKNNEFITHGAFNYILEDGFWISKYEASISPESNCYAIPEKNNCDKDIFDIYSLENRNSLKNISISNASKISINMNKQFNIYGLGKDVLPHLTTNLEWGAVAYLLNSKYGKNINETSVKDFDTTGEFVFGNYNNDTGLDKNNNSGFKPDGSIEWPIHPYMDIYKSISLKAFILGDATKEVNNLNQTNEFVNGEKPFMIRGIYNKFSYNNSTGAPNADVTFRPVISNVQLES